MSSVPVVLGGLAVLALVVSLLTNYGNRRTTPPFLQLVALVSWLGPFCVPFLLSLDITSTLYDECYASPECTRRPPYAYVSQDALHTMWSTIYWSAFLVTWGTIPVLQAYITSGEFDFWPKLRDALRANVIYYLVVGSLGGIVLVYIALKTQIATTAALRAVVMAASNAWGLTLIVLFLGYGLVAIPRGLWQSADAWWCLRRAEFRAVELQDDAADADAELYEILQELAIVDRKVGRMHPLRFAVDILLKIRPLPDASPSPLRRLPLSDDSAVDTPDAVTLKYLTKLHVRLKSAIRKCDRDNCIWRNLCKDAFLLQDIVSNAQNIDRKFHSTLRMASGGSMSEAKTCIAWWWYIRVRPLLRRALAVFSGVMSLAVLWSELTFNVKSPKLSLVSIAMQNTGSYSWLEIISFVTVTYMCLCSYTTLMRIKVFSLYELVPDGHTDPASLLFVGSYLCRLTIPLCYNFLNLAAEEVDTVFSKIMGHIDLVPLFGSFFNDWFPTALLVPVLLTVCNVYGRVLHVFGVRQLVFEDDDDVCADIEEGKRVLGNARKLEENRFATSGRSAGAATGARATPPSQRGIIPAVGTRSGRADFPNWDRSSGRPRTDVVEPESQIFVRTRNNLDDSAASSRSSSWIIKRLFSKLWGDSSRAHWQPLSAGDSFSPEEGDDDRQLFTSDYATQSWRGLNTGREFRSDRFAPQSAESVEDVWADPCSAELSPFSVTTSRTGSSLPRDISAVENPAHRPGSGTSGRVFGRSPFHAGTAKKQLPENIFGSL